MEDTNGSIQGKLSAVTSVTKASRQKSNAKRSTNAGNPVTSKNAEFQKESEKIKDALAVAKDLLDKWPCRLPNGEMPKPHIFTEYGVLMIALPLGGHVIENTVTSIVTGDVTENKHDFLVDGEPIIPVTSEKPPLESEKK